MFSPKLCMTTGDNKENTIIDIKHNNAVKIYHLICQDVKNKIFQFRSSCLECSPYDISDHIHQTYLL